MKTNSDPINDQAAAWFARLLSPECSDRDRDNFEQWCAASERHANAFAAVAQCHEDAAALKNDQLMFAVARSARNARRSPAHGARSGHLSRFAAVAVLLLAIAGGTLWFVRDHPSQTVRYATSVGEQRSVILADGTRVRLDTDTTFGTRFSDTSRELVLDHGRIQVDVAKDAGREFSVRSGRGIVRDVGTEFQVENYGDDVTVTLISGLVSVALTEPARNGKDASVLAPGQQLRVGARGDPGAPMPIDPASVAGWTEGILTFKDRRLGDLLEEMNRYSAMKIRVVDPALARLQVSGVFRAGDQSSLLQTLQKGWSMRSKRITPNEIVLSSGP